MQSPKQGYQYKFKCRHHHKSHFWHTLQVKHNDLRAHVHEIYIQFTLLYQLSWNYNKLEGVSTIWGVFTWTRITFRKTFRNVIQNVIGIVIWTTCVYITWATNAFPITIRNCALRVIFCSYYAVRALWLTHALMHGFSAHFLNAHARITFRNSFAFTWTRIRLFRRITIQNAPFFAFQNAFQKPDLKQPFVYMG